MQGRLLIPSVCLRPRQLVIKTLYLATSHYQGEVNKTVQTLLKREVVEVYLEGISLVS